MSAGQKEKPLVRLSLPSWTHAPFPSLPRAIPVSICTPKLATILSRCHESSTCMYTCLLSYIHIYVHSAGANDTNIIACSCVRAPSGIGFARQPRGVACCCCCCCYCTVEQAKVTGCIGRQAGDGEGIDQVVFAFLDIRSPSLHHAMPCFNLHIKIYRNS